MPEWIHQLAGRFLVFDGPDGSGKSTQLARFAARCRAAGLAVCEVREPGGTSIGEQIRRVLLDPANAEMCVACEVMLYMASRGQLVVETIAPALARGELVLADRFVSSTLAYQGTAGGLPVEDILAVGRVAIGGRWPDLTVILDVDEQTAEGRLDPRRDRIEQREAGFHRRVREGFLAQARERPDEHLVINASPAIDVVTESLVKQMEAWVTRS